MRPGEQALPQLCCSVPAKEAPEHSAQPALCHLHDDVACTGTGIIIAVQCLGVDSQPRTTRGLVGKWCVARRQQGCLVRCCAALCRFPGRKEENWWLVVGDPKGNTLLAIKRQALQKKGRAKLDITAPSEPGTHHLTLFFMCDSYMGCDQVRLPSWVLVHSPHAPHGMCMPRKASLRGMASLSATLLPKCHCSG